jgi:hypothetical protein
VVNECLTPLNFLLAMEACGWFVERAALEHTERKGDALALVGQLELWLQAWGDQVSRGVAAAEVRRRLAEAGVCMLYGTWAMLECRQCRSAWSNVKQADE